MRDAPPKIIYNTRRSWGDDSKQHLEIQVEAEIEPTGKQHMKSNLKPESEVKFQKESTSRAQRKREAYVELEGDTIELVGEKDIEETNV